jgi:hypothetical protein
VIRALAIPREKKRNPGAVELFTIVQLREPVRSTGILTASYPSEGVLLSANHRDVILGRPAGHHQGDPSHPARLHVSAESCHGTGYPAE